MRLAAVTVCILLISHSLCAQQDSLDLGSFFFAPPGTYLVHETPASSTRSLFTLGKQDHLNEYLDVKKPLFCRMESRWEKRSGQALKFRLGSVEVVDRYEGKDDKWGLR